MKFRLSILLLLLLCSLGNAQGPWLGGQQEFVMGLRTQPTTLLGLYVYRKTGTSIAGFVDKSGIDLRLGYMGWKVVSSQFAEKECTLLETDALTTVTQKSRNLQNLFKRKITRQTYVQNDKIVRERYTWNDETEDYRCEVLYGADTIELTVNGPKGAKTTTVFPAGGVEQFHAAFTPMVKDGQLLMKEKTFAVLQPITGGLQKVVIRQVGVFDFNITSKGMVKKKGWCFEIVWPDHTEKAYISDRGELVKVDLPASRTLLTEDWK